MRRRALAALAAMLALGGSTAGAAGGARHHTVFESPSRNIGCAIFQGVARCDIAKRSWVLPKRPAGCPSEVDFGQGLEVSANGPAHVVCAGDTALDRRAPILGYGERNVRGALSCVSATTGITCRSSRTGHGFFLSKERYRLF